MRLKRWMIRSFFIGLLLLCVGGWGVSYAFEAMLLYVDKTTSWNCDLELSEGRCYLNVSSGDWPDVEGWLLLYGKYHPTDSGYEQHFNALDFHFSHDGSRFWRLGIPF